MSTLSLPSLSTLKLGSSAFLYVSFSPSLFLVSSRCLSGESLSAHHARATFDLYARKSHFAVAIYRSKWRYRVALQFPCHALCSPFQPRQRSGFLFEPSRTLSTPSSALLWPSVFHSLTFSLENSAFLLPFYRCIAPHFSSVDLEEQLDEDDFESKVNKAW